MAMPSGLSSRDVVWTATPSDTYRTGNTTCVGMPYSASSCMPPCDFANLQAGDGAAMARIQASRPRSWPRLQNVRSQLGQGAALAFGERDVARQALQLELVHHVHEAVVGRVHVGIVDL